jgi:hypothetical protein
MKRTHHHKPHLRRPRYRETVFSLPNKKALRSTQDPPCSPRRTTPALDGEKVVPQFSSELTDKSSTAAGCSSDWGGFETVASLQTMWREGLRGTPGRAPP